MLINFPQTVLKEKAFVVHFGHYSNLDYRPGKAFWIQGDWTLKNKNKKKKTQIFLPRGSTVISLRLKKKKKKKSCTFFYPIFLYTCMNSLFIAEISKPLIYKTMNLYLVSFLFFSWKFLQLLINYHDKFS